MNKVGQKAYCVPPIMMEMQIKMRYHFMPLRIRQHQMLSWTTLISFWVGTSVARSMLGKDTHPLEVVIPLPGTDSRESIVAVVRKMFPAILLVIAKFEIPKLFIIRCE